MTTVRSEARLQHSLAEITRLLERHQVLESLTSRLEGPRRDLLEHLQHRQNLAELQARLGGLHFADIAYIIEALPLDARRTVWDQIEPGRAGDVFMEVSDAVRESLVDLTPRDRLVKVLASLDAEDLAYVSASLADEVVEEVSRALESGDRSVFEESIQYEDDRVGRHMSREWVAVSDSYTIERALEEIRKLDQLPPQTDRIYVIDARSVLRGTIGLPALLLKPPAASVVDVMGDEAVTFSPHDDAADAVKAFERYDLISAPVVDDRGKLVGRLTVDAAMDVLRDESSLRALKHAGLSGDEDLAAGPWDSARNRWPWLALNLLTAFIASRVIGQFEGAIQELAALAALMPIVASVGGNTGNQTMALVIRALAVDRLQSDVAGRLFSKELWIGAMNGLVWGVIVGLLAIVIYRSGSLGLVMTGAVVLNLIVAAVAGVLIPLALFRAGRDPAHGSSVLLTFITDAMGFFLFLGLASVFLL